MFLAFKETCTLFATVAAQLHIPTSGYRGSPLSASLPARVTLCLGFQPLDWGAVIPRCDFDLRFPDASHSEHFSCTYWPFVFLLLTTAVEVLRPFLNCIDGFSIIEFFELLIYSGY